ncbi:MAG TPA: hypothetical protein PLA50_02895 [Bacteroidia bacterium]|nr:hypothetical protein [Bacteroidia bacterium]
MIRFPSLLIAALVAICRLGLADEPGFASRIAAFEALRDRPFPDGFDMEKPMIESKHFDLSEYFKVLPHLRIREGRVLDWVYEAACPVLYSRGAEEMPFGSIGEFIDSIRERAQLDEVEKVQRWYRQEYLKLFPEGVPSPDPFGEEPTDADLRRDRQARILQGTFDLWMKAIPNQEYWNFWREDVFCDGSDEGFKELATLYLMANEFFLFQGAKASAHRVFASREQMIESVTKLPPGFFHDFEESEKDRVDAIGLLDPSPTVVRHGGKVQVRLLVFEEVCGYARKVFTFSEAPPHSLLSEREIVEVEYLVTRIY